MLALPLNKVAAAQNFYTMLFDVVKPTWNDLKAHADNFLQQRIIIDDVLQ